VDALQHGYRPIVIEDAVGDRSESSHKQSLFDMNQKYADVMACNEVIQGLISSTSRDSLETGA
jgi:maleamate amidohydrolase